MKKPKKKGEIDMNALTTRAGNDIKEMAAILANYPAPNKWTQAQRNQAVQFAALLDTAQKMILAANLSGINFKAEKDTFLENAGRSKSEHTRTAYGAALDRLEAWVNRQKVNPLELEPAQADDFIYSLSRHEINPKTEKPYSTASAYIRLVISASSSFYTWLERRHAGVNNPFRGTKARPVKKAKRDTVIPSAEEVETIIRELPAYEAAAVAIMAYRGLRVGALRELSISRGKFSGHSKGKDLSGAVPAIVLEKFKAADLPFDKPFVGESTNTFQKRIARAIEKLRKAGKVQAGYSCHDLRHFYAVTEYNNNKDIHRLSKLLGHASILVTENYLKGLGEVE
jgi:site-specific recombinase XerD